MRRAAPATLPNERSTGSTADVACVIDVWQVALRASSATFGALRARLTEDELTRASGFGNGAAGRAFVIARGALRVLLARETGVEGGSLRFSYNARGKPAIDPPNAVRFNVSHSGGLALVAIARGCDVGVDVELIRPLTGLLGVAEDVLAPEDVTYLTLLAEAEREAAFFQIWSRREAYLKANGEGLIARAAHIGGGVAAAWSLHDLTIAPEYAAALAYGGNPRPLRVRPLLDADRLLLLVDAAR